MTVSTFKNADAERVLVNQMIIDPSIVPNVYDMVKPDTFSVLSYRKCYELILGLIKSNNGIVDEIVFRDECNRVGGFSTELIADVTSATFTADNWEYYAKQVQDCFNSRSISILLSKASGKLTESNGQEVINEIVRDASEISASTSSCEIYDVHDLASSYIQTLNDRFENKGQVYTGYPTGLANLDEVINGIQKEYIVVAARPSLGKTALCQQIAMHMAGGFGGSHEKVKVMFIELEMSATQLTERAITAMSRTNTSRLRSGMLTAQQLSKVMFKVSELSELTNFIPVTCKSRKLTDIANVIRRGVRTMGVQAVFIDHLGLIKADGNFRSDWENYKEISHALQQLQRELEIPVIALSQVGRESEGKENNLASIRGSGAIEEDADTVMFIERDRQHDISEDNIKAKINIVKNRNGACGSAKVIFCPKFICFTDDNGQFDNPNEMPNMERAEKLSKNKSFDEEGSTW